MAGNGDISNWTRHDKVDPREAGTDSGRLLAGHMDVVAPSLYRGVDMPEQLRLSLGAVRALLFLASIKSARQVSAVSPVAGDL